MLCLIVVSQKVLFFNLPNVLLVRVIRPYSVVNCRLLHNLTIKLTIFIVIKDVTTRTTAEIIVTNMRIASIQLVIPTSSLVKVASAFTPGIDVTE